MQSGIALDEWKQKLFADAVHLIEEQKDRPVKSPDPIERKLVPCTEFRRGVHDQGEHVHALDRVLRLIHHHPAEDIFGLVNTRSVDQYDLRPVAV